MSEPGRSFAGYTYQQRLAVGFFGEVYRAVSADNRVVRILHVGPHLAALEGFSDALAQHGGQLGLLEHKHAESTILVGSTPDGVCVVITESAAGAMTLEQVLKDARSAGTSVPTAVALGISTAVLAALAHAHRVGLCHGGVHPRTVRVDTHGDVKLADFAAARALAAAAAAADDPQILKAKGYVAPELALGDEPSRSSDVYAAGALIFELLAGAPPPGKLAGPAAVAAVLDQALATDPGNRFSSAVELRAAFDLAVAEVGLAVAPVKEIAAFVNLLRKETEASLDAETEDVLASLAAGPPVEEPPEPAARRAATVKPGARASAGTDVESVLDELVAGLPTSSKRASTLRVDTEDVEEEEDAPTAVDHRQVSVDPVSELIRADPSGGVKPLVRFGSESDGDDEDTYLPPAMTESDLDLDAIEDRGRADSAERKAKRPAPAAMRFRPASGTDPVAPVLPQKSGSGLWIFTTVVALVGLFVVLYTQTDVFHPERRKQKELEREAEYEAQKLEAEANRVRAGDVIVDASEPEAAVWLLLGRTPVDTIDLSAAAVHQVRIEHEGYQAADFSVLGSQWSGSGTSMNARLMATLEPARPEAVTPAYPPAPNRPTTGRTGRGSIRIESEPSGAHAYLLVGFTPDVQLRGVRAKEAYEFKVVKDGFAPGFVVIRAEDWTTEAGAVKRSVEGAATLAPLPPRKK